MNNSEKTIDFLLQNIEPLNQVWNNKIEKVFLPLQKEYRHHAFNDIIHDIKFKDYEYRNDSNISILFSHFSPMKYELEALEMPLYISKIMKNANIDMCYFDSRNRISNNKKCYIFNVKNGNLTSPKNNFNKKYDLIISKSDSLKKLRAFDAKLFKESGKKININDMNYTPCKNHGEDYAFKFYEFYTSGGRKFTNQSNDTRKKQNYKSYNIISIVGTIVWWKGQLEWLEKVDPELIKDYIIVLYGNIDDYSYYNKIIQVANKKKINLLHTTYVNPKFLCDILTYSKFTVMNPYVDLPHQPTLGTSRCFGESLSCNSYCLLGQTYNKPYIEKIGKTSFVPENWLQFTKEYDQNSSTSLNLALENALKINVNKMPWKNLISIEENCNNIIEKCLNI